MIRKLRQMRSRLVTGSVLLVLLLAVASTCRPKTTAVSTGSDNGVKPQSAAATPDASQSPSVNGTVPRPVASRPTRATQVEQTATLTAVDPAAQINVRSQPSQASPPVGYGQVGEAVILGRTAADTAGYTWHHVTFTSDSAVGWVRADLLAMPTVEAAETDASTPVSPEQAPSDTLKQALDETCGGQSAIEAYFVTPSNTIYICKVRNQRTYLSQEAGTEQIVTAQEVETLGGGYIVTNGNFEYRVDSGSLVIVRFDDTGQQAEILREYIVFTNRY